MTYEYVYVGAEPDDGTGDPLRTAYIKINNNFAQLQQFGTTKISNGTSNINIPYANGAIYTMVGDVPNVMVINPSGVTGSNLTAVGNVVALTNFVGNGYYLTDVSIRSGNSSVTIPTPNGNVNTTANGNLTLGVADRKVTVYGDLSVTGNATISGNITRNSISYGSSFLGFGASDGNANVTIAGVSNVAVFTTTGLNVTGTVTGTTLSATGTVSGTTVSASGTVTGTTVSATGTVSGTTVSASGTVTGTTVSATGTVTGTTVSATGNVIGGNIVGVNTVQGNTIVGDQGVYGNIFTTLIDSPDSSQITVTPDTRFSASVTIDTELAVDLILSQRINTSILSASGNILGPIPSVSQTWYVAKNGSDSNDGGLNTPFLTIKRACTAAAAYGPGTAIRIASGTYVEDNPVTIPPKTALMGDNLRTVSVIPANPAGDLFYMTNAVYVWGITVRDYLGAAFSYNPDGSANNVYTSPYIQNITSYTTTGTGVRIDGSKVSSTSTKAMIVGFYTIINKGGIGIDLSNSAYSQLVNIYTIGTEIGIRAQSGAFCTLNGSDCSIGTYGLVATGIGPLQTSGNTIGDSIGGTFVIGQLTNGNPHVNTVMFINDKQYSTTSSNTLTIAVQVAALTIGINLKYSAGQTVIIAYNATNFMTGTVVSYNDSSGALVVDVTGTEGSGTYSSWRVNLFPLKYYTIDTIIKDTPAVGNATVIIQEVYTANLVADTNVEFYTRSAIIASAHTFEYVGAGNDPATALPQYGGIPVPANEVVTANGGVVTFTSTDQKGNFRVGKGFTVNQATGTVSGDDFYRSLFAIMTPYILALQEVP